MTQKICKAFACVVFSLFFISAIGSTHAYAGGGGGGHEGGGGAEYVELSPLVLPIMDDQGVSQTLSLVVAIEVADAAAAKKIESIAPKLQDAYIQDMYGVLDRQTILNAGGVVEVRMLKKRLTKLSKHIAGEIVDDVLLQVVSQQPI